MASDCQRRTKARTLRFVGLRSSSEPRPKAAYRFRSAIKRFIPESSDWLFRCCASTWIVWW
jgi:hypothetical protein